MRNQSEQTTTSPIFGIWRGPFTGRHMLILITAFFGIIIIANVYLVRSALRSYPGEDIKQSYRQGLAYNQTLAARAAQTATGWRADITTSTGQVELSITDENQLAIRGLMITGLLKHPAKTALDVPLQFAFNESMQIYTAPYDIAINGRYIIVSQANWANDSVDTDPVFKTKNTMMIKAP